MALTRAQLLSGDTNNGVVLAGQPQGVRPGGTGITIDTNGIISVNSSTITGVMKLNNTGAYNSYIWPASPSNKKFLQTDGAGLLSWSDPSGFAVVTVQSQPAPTPADVGELWFDCTTGTLNVYQNCVGTPSPNWFNVAQPGLPVLPSNTSAAPAFTGGNGTQATPYDCSVTTASSGASVFVVNVVTISGLAPFQYVPVIDLNSVANGGRFSFTNNYADASGSLTFETVFIDQPASPPSTTYTAAIKVGYGTVYIDAVVNVVTPLSTTPGSISGTPQVGSTLTYTQGVASGGTGPYTYTQVWKRDGVTISAATGLTYVLVSADIGKNITVEITATDATLSVATATTASVGPITTAPFPALTWNPTPSNGMDSNPGGQTGTYSGTATSITTTGCVEASVNGGAYSIGTQAITSGQSLAVRWASTSGCGGAASGTTITGTITDSTYTNSYSLAVNRKPTAFGFTAGSTSAPLSSVQTSNTVTITGINSVSYVTVGSLTAGATSLEASINGGGFVAIPAATSTSLPISTGETLQIRFTTGSTASTTYTAVVNIGDGDAVQFTASSPGFVVINTSSPVFPSTTFAPFAGPTASPANTVLTGPPALNGTATATWADGSTTLTATGSLQFQVNGGGYTQTSTAVANGNTVDLRWNPTAAASAADAASLTGTLTNSTYTNTYTLVVDKQPSTYTWTDQTSVTASSTVTSNVVTIAGINCPAELTYTAGATNTLTSVQASVDGGAFTNIPTSSPGLVINPADAAGTAATTIQLRATVGAGVSTAYTLTTNIGKGAAVVSDEWSVTTAAIPASITTPSITSPANNTTNLNPATNSPAGIPLVGSTYTPLNGAGATQTSSTWEVAKGGLLPSFQSANSATAVATAVPTVGAAAGGGYFAGQISTAGNSVADYNLIVAPVTSGSLRGQNGGSSPSGIQYKTPASADAPSATVQNVVYGGPTTDLFKSSAAHPVFSTFINGATGPNAGAFNLTTGGAGGGTGIGGYNDWYLPAKNELDILYYNLKPTTQTNSTTSGINPNAVPARASNYTAGTPAQTTSALFQTGGAQAFGGPNPYWSSSEGSSNTTFAWLQYFSVGGQGASLKTDNSYARAIRRVSVSTPFAQTITISAANTDGFAVGQSVKGSVSNAIGTITAIDGTTVTVSLTSGTFQSGDFLVGNGTAVTGSPFTVSSAPFTTVNVLQSALTTSSTYYARVQYATTNVTAATSSFSGWSSFGTAASFLPSPGTAMAGGYFGGQINDGGTIYNLIVAPITAGSLRGQNGGSSPSGVAYKTSNSADAPSATVQNLVYGGPTTDLLKASAANPAFSTFINGATGPNAGAFNLTTGGAGSGTGIGGFNDWYLPAKNELEILYYNLKPDSTSNNTSYGINPNAVPARASNYTAGNPAQTADALFAGGAQAFSAGSYWSSSEFSSSAVNAWLQPFNTGGQFSNLKTGGNYARAIRRISA